MRSTAGDLNGPEPVSETRTRDGTSLGATAWRRRGARRPWSIRTWLILLVLATIAPLATYGLYSTAKSYQAERSELVGRTVTLSRDVGRAVERLLDRQLIGVEALAGAPALAQGEFDRFSPLAAHYLAAIAPGSQIIVSNAEGTITFAMTSPGSIGEPTKHRADLAINRAVFATGSSAVRLIPAAAAGRWLIAIDAPVMQDGKVVADLTLDLPVAQIEELLTAQHIPPGWTAIVTDPAGRLVARIPAEPRSVGEPHTADVLSFLRSGKQSVTLDTRLRDGTSVIGALTRTPHFGWASGVAIPEALVLEPLRTSLSKLAAVGLAALVISLGLAVVVARRLSRPVTAVARMAAQFDSADAIPPAPPPSLREADDVARALELAMRRRRAAEETARDAEMRASRVIADAPCGFIVFGADGAWRLVNPAACDLLGRPEGELLDMTIRSPDFDVRDKDGQPLGPDERASARALRGETVRGFEVSMKRGDGSRVSMLFNSAPLRDSQGRITGALTAMLDISDRRAAEERLASLLQTLETRVQEEVAAREAAQVAAAQAQKMQALGQVAGGVAHDFNNVLQAISGAVSLIESRAARPEEVRRFARTAAAAAERGASVAGRLLAFARRSDLTAAPVDAAALLSDVRLMLAHTLGGDVEVRIEMAPDVGWLLADRAQLETALVNLATNARDAMPAGGTLTLRARREQMDGHAAPANLVPGTYVRLDVVDTGTGMDAATLARATEPFFTTKPLDKGTGLGLAMVRGFAEQLNGGLEIASHVGEGTRVSIWLPATSPGPALSAPSPASMGGSPGLRLLLVDDEPEVRAVLAEELSERGWTVEQASCAQEAIELLREANFDALVADQSMPGESGTTLIGLARRLRPGLPAILLTGLAPEVGGTLTDTPEHAAITEVAGKPIRAEELARRIERLCARASRPEASARRQREAEALRENLRRRKAQARARAADADEET